MKKLSLLFASLMILVLVACNLPSTGGQPTASAPDAAYTQAAQTVEAELTRIAENASPTPNIPSETPLPTNTNTPAPTNTPIVTATNTPLPCLMVGFNKATIDQTVPDNTIMSPGQVFVKTWRLINLGTCTWNSSYQLVFDHGDGMGVPTGYSQTMTAGSVAPGKSVDVSVTLTAPSAAGTYTGYWRFRDPNMIYFGIGGAGTWVVKIKVVNAITVTLSPVGAGTVSGTIGANEGPYADFTVGESNNDITKTVEALLTYDISGIPTNATITEVKTDFSDYDPPVGNPFGLGVLNGYVANYGPTLEQADFVTGFPNGNVIDWGSTNALNKIEVSPELKSAIQSKLGSGKFQLRLQFPGSNGDAVKDRLTLTNPSIIIKYVAP
jgi:Ig-like domain from next to BRCA1 gene